MKNYKKYILPILFGLFIISSGYSQALCEPVYNVDKQVQIFSVGDQMYPDPSCNPASESCYNTFVTIGQPLVNSATQYWDADANEYDTSNSLSNYSYSSSSVDNINSFGFFNDYISEPKPPIVTASDGDFQDMVLIQWQLQGCQVNDNNCQSIGPPITSTEVILYRNGYILTTLPIAQTEYQDLNVFPGEYYTYGVTLENDMGESQTDDDVGFINPNGMITGHIETPSGSPVFENKVYLTPNLGRSAKFNGDGYVFWFDNEISTNKQFDGLSGDYTVETWFRTLHTQQQTLFAAVDSSSTNHYIHIELTDQGQIRWQHNSTPGGSGASITSVSSFTNADNPEWHHLAVVHEGTYMAMYIDGMIAGEATSSGAFNDKVEIVLGKKGPRSSEDYYIGRMDDFRIWSAARSWDDILKLMDITLDGSEDDLYTYWKFDEVEGDVLFDLTENNLDGNVCRVERSDNIAPVYLGALTDENGNYIIKGIYYAGGTSFTVTPVLETPIGRSVKLNGSDYISFEGQRIDLMASYTLEGWFKTVSTEDQTIFAGVDPETDENQLEVSMSNGLVTATYFGSSTQSDTTYNDNLWTHWAVAKDEESFSLYLNAEFVGSVSVLDSPTDLSSLVMGRKSTEADSVYYIGLLDEIRMWDYARNQDQIGGTKNQVLNGDEFGLVQYWKINDGIGTLITNTVSNVTGTLEGSIEWKKDIPLNEYFSHWYEPESRQSTLNQYNTSVDQVSFTDNSMIPVTGYIRYENTACFQESVEILIDGDQQWPPIMTNQDGKYTVELEPGSIGKIISPSYEDHEFLPPMIELPMLTQPITGLYFNDTKTFKSQGTVAGGSCKHPINPSMGVIEVTYRSVNGCIEENINPNPYGGYSTSDLPPLIYNVTINHPDDSVDGYFLGDTLSLEDADRVHDFIYYAMPEGSITGIPENATCGFKQLEMLQEYTIQINIFESYMDHTTDTTKTCAVDSGTVVINNLLSFSSPAESLPFTDGLLEYTFKAGKPNMLSGDHPYQKNIQATITDSQGRTANVTEWAVILGNEERETFFATTAPEVPLMIIHAPPGDQSFAYWSSEETVETSMSFGLAHESNSGGYLTTSSGPDITTSLGMGAEIEFEVDATLDMTETMSTTITQTSTTEQTWSFSTSETISTTFGGDVYIGGAINILYGITDVLKLEGCNFTIEAEPIIVPDGFATAYVYSEYYITNVLIPSLLAIDDTTHSAARWENIIEKNHANMNTAILVENRSFDAGTTYEYEFSETSFGSSSFEMEMEMEETFVFDMGLQVNGVGYVGGFNIGTSISMGTSLSNEQGTTNTFGFSFGDDDIGDAFTVNIKTDQTYGSPVFSVVGGASSCPWEYGIYDTTWDSSGLADWSTVPYDGPTLGISSSFEIDVPPDDPGVFELYVGNTSQMEGDREYWVKVINATNPNGAAIALNGVILESHMSYFVPYGEQVTTTMTVTRGPEEYEYDNIQMQVVSPCQYEWWEGGQAMALSDTVTFSVHYQEPCSESNIANIEEGWLIDSQFESDSLWVTVDGYDPEDENLISVDLQYRSGAGDWFTAASVVADSLVDDYVLLPFNVSPNIVIDGEYQLRSQAICGGGKYPGTSAVLGGLIDREGPLVFGNPTPIDGILGPDDVISVTFNEDIQCGDISIGAGDIALYNSVLGIPVDFAFSCGGNMITFDPIPANIYLENQVFRAEVHNLSDMYGNLREESITWEFFVNKNPIEWNGANIDNIVLGTDEEYMTQRELVNTGGSNRSYTIIGGREGAVASGEPLNLPVWISVSPFEGTLTPGASQNIDIGLIEGLDFGSYQTTIYAAGTMGDEPMIIDIRKLCDDPGWSLYTSDYQYTMNITATLSTEGELSADEYDIVGVFAGDELRGVAEITYLPALANIGVHPYEVFLTIYSNITSGEELTMRVWDSSECTELGWVEENYLFEANSTLGTPTTPVTITATSQIIAHIDYPSGWTWFSMNLQNNNMGLNSVFANLNLTSSDIIKDQTSYAQYVPDAGWVGPLSELNNQSMYLINMGNANTLEMIGYAVNVELDTIDVVSGWNWIAYTPQLSIELNTALNSLSSATGDIIKSQFFYAQYVEGIGWLGSLSYMNTELGYMLKSLYPGELVYPFTEGQRGEEENQNYMPPLARMAPGWQVDPERFEHNMTITGTGFINDAHIDNPMDMIGAYAMVDDGAGGYTSECRGIAQPIFIEALDSWTFFMMIYGNTPGDELEFRLFDAGADHIWGILESIEFNPNIELGTVLKPYSWNALPQIGDVNFDGELNVLDIVATIQYVLGSTTLTDIQFMTADLTGDGLVNMFDIVLLVNEVLGIELVRSNSEPVEVELAIQGNNVRIKSENTVAGLQMDILGISEFISSLENYTRQTETGLRVVFVSTEGSLVNDGVIFTSEGLHEHSFENVLISDRNGQELSFTVKMLPEEFALSQNYPNPFNPTTIINFGLPVDSEVHLMIYDIMGREVATLVDGFMEAGYHKLQWNSLNNEGKTVANGMYLYRLTTSGGDESFSSVKKMVLLK